MFGYLHLPHHTLVVCHDKDGIMIVRCSRTTGNSRESVDIPLMIVCMSGLGKLRGAMDGDRRIDGYRCRHVMVLRRWGFVTLLHLPFSFTRHAPPPLPAGLPTGVGRPKEFLHALTRGHWWRRRIERKRIPYLLGSTTYSRYLTLRIRYR